MATTKIFPIHTTLKETLAYIANPKRPTTADSFSDLCAVKTRPKLQKILQKSQQEIEAFPKNERQVSQQKKKDTLE